jgi:hypothetical protein
MRPSIKHLAIAAAVSGLFAGTALTELHAKDPGKYGLTQDYAGDKNACKGMNECKGKGGCATVKHECKGHNECKGLGGCKAGANGCKGKNECKGKGGCKVGK